MLRTYQLVPGNSQLREMETCIFFLKINFLFTRNMVGVPRKKFTAKCLPCGIINFDMTESGHKRDTSLCVYIIVVRLIHPNHDDIADKLVIYVPVNKIHGKPIKVKLFWYALIINRRTLCSLPSISACGVILLDFCRLLICFCVGP